jgi:hypothetical protein
MSNFERARQATHPGASALGPHAPDRLQLLWTKSKMICELRLQVIGAG